MKPLINCAQIKKTYSDKTLFENFTFSLNEGARLGLIGPNGAGKSTLLKALTRETDVDEGKVVSKKNLSIHSVSQSAAYSEELTVREAILGEIMALRKGLGLPRDDEIEAIGEEMALGSLDTKVGTLSGGGLKKIQLAAAFLSSAELVFFDEPTNHLDLKTILWLEGRLQRAPFAWVCIAHDRYFLDKVAREFIELSPVYEGCALVTKGNYHEFLKQKEIYLAEKDNKEQTMANKLRKEEKWLKTSPKARTTKSKFRIEKAHELGSDLRASKTRNQSELGSFSFVHTERKSKKILNLKDMSYKIGDKELFKNENLEITVRQRIGLLGLNGSGKSTLLRILAEKTAPDSGRVEAALNLKISYFDQERKLLETKESIQSFLGDGGDHVIYNGRSIHISSWIKKFGFNFEKKDASVASLSGGEKAKIFIAKLLLEPCDLLILDEPTNDLDIDSLEVLEQGLSSFPGTFVLVSHDRFFLNRVCQKFIGIGQEQGLKNFQSLEEWLKSLRSKDSKKSKKTNSEGKKQIKSSSPKLSYMEQRELGMMEGKIAKIEEKIEKLKEEMVLPENLSSHGKLSTLGASLSEKESELADLYERWGLLEEKKSLSEI